jgi:RNA polymerase sigma-70 factor (ECF subfamily)
LTENQLIAALKQRNEQAFTLLVSNYQNMVFNTILAIVQHFHDAEDLAQDVFIQVYESIDGFRQESKLSTWIYKISITKSLDFERAKKAKKRINLLKNLIGIGEKEENNIVEFHHPGIALDKKEEAIILFKAIKQLPQNQRIAFVLIKTEGLSYNAVSQILNISEKAVEGLMHRAKENLRKILSNYYINANNKQ